VKIGDKISVLRKNLKLSQTELAQKSGLTPPAICQYEKGLRIPTVKALRAISIALCVNINEFLYEHYVLIMDNDEDEYNEGELILAQFSSLSPENKLALKHFLNYLIHQEGEQK
jgi:transcriptional regulator with XRE-family HTH domain